MHFLDLAWAILFEPVFGGLSRLKEIVPHTSMQMVRSNKNNIIYSNDMKTNRNELIRRLLSGLTDDELENLVRLREEARRPIPTPRKRIPTPAPRKMVVKQLIRYFENNNLYKPLRPNKQQSRPQSIPAPTTKKQQPVAAPWTKIGEKQRALKGFTKSYEIGLKTDRDALVQLQNTRLAISRLFNTILNNTKGFKFVETLKVTFVKRKDDDNIFKPAYFNSRAQIVINPNDFFIKLAIITATNIDEHFINTVVYEPMRSNSYIPLPVKLQNSAKGLINLQNKDNECFRWCHIRYLNPQERRS